MIPRPRTPAFGTLRLPEKSPVPELLRRILLATTLILLTAIGLWFDRDGLRDNTHPERGLIFSDVLYFTVVSLTTVGYGDIVPVTEQARLTNAILLTPIRVFLWLMFLGTAYELTLQRYRERIQMDQLRKRLKDHIIVCGYGVKGRAIVSELLAHGHTRDDIIVIESDETAARDAAAQDFIALRGDASSEAILQAAAIEKAAYVLAAPNRDDICVLICLTVRSLAPQVYLVASAREEENVKLLYRAGANLVVSPSVSGGKLMAAAVRQKAVPEFLEDLLSFGQGVDAAERVIKADEDGRLVSELTGMGDALVLGVKRGNERCPFHQLTGYRLRAGDIVVYLVSADECKSDRT
jgi:voltage-gated potassium channel